MSFLSFSEWLLLKEAKRRKPAKNTAIDGFIKSVEELEKDIEKLSKYEKSAEAKKKKEKKDDKKSPEGEDEDGSGDQEGKKKDVD
jgi:hypothetical protein